MRHLILDTSTSQSILAICEQGVALSETIVEQGPRLCATLFPSIKSLLDETDQKVDKLDGIAIGVGPGSFMGVRTGATIGKTLCYALSIPLIPFPSPIAFIPKEYEESSFIITGDAKMGEHFLIRGNIQRGLSSPTLHSKEEIEQKLAGETNIITALKDPNISLLARYVHQLHLDGKIERPNTLSLNYLR